MLVNQPVEGLTISHVLLVLIGRLRFGRGQSSRNW